METGKLFSIQTIILLLTCTLTLALNTPQAKATTIRVPLDYPTIQQAISAANPGDTIMVSPGTYHEQISINFKNNLTIIAEDFVNTIIQGEENATVVRISNSHNVTLQGFVVKGLGYRYPQLLEGLIEPFPWRTGILVDHSSNINLKNNTVTKNLYGVSLYYSHNVTMENNNVTGNVYNFGVEGGGDSLSYYLHNIDKSNLVDGKRIYYEVNQSNLIIDSFSYSDIGYLGLINSQNVTIKNLNISNNYQGILLAYTNNSKVQNVNVSYNKFGLTLTNSVENFVNDNEISANIWGLMIQGFGFGYELPSFNNNTIIANKILNNTLGMALVYSGGNILRSNNMTDNMFNFGVFGIEVDYLQDIDTSNTINGKPIYYLVKQHNIKVPFDAGYVAAVYSTNITIKDLTLSNNLQGVLLAQTAYSLIENVVASSNLIGVHFSGNLRYPNYSLTGNILSRSLVINNFMTGIFCVESSDNTVIGNTISSGGTGIWLQSSGNTIICNTISNNSRGIYFDEVSYNHYIINNTVSYNDEGIVIGYLSGKSILYHNNFINNTKQVTVEPWSYAYENTWDNGYPFGGNYWSDYNGTDLYSGVYQNETGSDGIGDTPYVIRENETDNYPLINPWIPEDTFPPTIGALTREPEDMVLPDQEVHVSVKIADAISGVKNATLLYTTDNGNSWIDIPMKYNSSTNQYDATIPGQPAGTWVRFKIVVYDHAGNNATFDGTEPYCTYEVIPEYPTTILALICPIIMFILTIITRKNRQS